MNRMFQVIVAGGVALTAHACGNTVEVASSGSTGAATGSSSSGFPFEGTTSPPTSGFGGYPQEGPAIIDGGFGGYPQEGPAIIDSGSDAPVVSDGAADASDASQGCFPMETAIQCDAGSPGDGG